MHHGSADIFSRCIGVELDLLKSRSHVFFFFLDTHTGRKPLYVRCHGRSFLAKLEVRGHIRVGEESRARMKI